MLSFLESILSKLQDLFGPWWYIVSWIVTSAYSYLSEYVGSLNPALRDYKNTWQQYLIDWGIVAKPKTDDIVVNNYSTTRYSAIDSFWDIFDYRNYKKSVVSWLQGNVQSSITTIVLGGFSILYYFIRNPFASIQYVLEKGRGIVLDYELSDRSNVKQISGNAPKIKKLSDEPSFSILDKVTGGWYSKIRTYIEDYYPSLSAIFNSVSRILSLVVGALYNRLTDLGGDKYPKLSRLSDRSQILERYAEEGNYRKYNYLINDRFGKLTALLEQPETSILAWLKGKFFDWFLQELWDYLNEEIDA